MQIPWYPWKLRAALDGRPNVGRLMDLCEENHRRLMRLVPGMKDLQGRFLSCGKDGVELYLEVLEQTPYTTLIHLTYYFDRGEAWQPDPDATLRIYHDAMQAEVLDLRQRLLPIDRDLPHATLQQKWRANLFLAKWLAYCLGQGHGFSERNSIRKDPRGRFVEAC